jgi:hypothetical protein
LPSPTAQASSNVQPSVQYAVASVPTLAYYANQPGQKGLHVYHTGCAVDPRNGMLCSGKGVCNTYTRRCICEQGRSGLACQL